MDQKWKLEKETKYISLQRWVSVLFMDDSWNQIATFDSVRVYDILGCTDSGCKNYEQTKGQIQMNDSSGHQ